MESLGGKAAAPGACISVPTTTVRDALDTSVLTLGTRCYVQAGGGAFYKLVVSGGSLTWAADGGGAGTVASVTGAATGIVDNTDPANPIIQAQFGSDTTVKLPNASSTLVNALEVIASLTVNTPAAEVSKWLIKVLNAGAQGSALSIEATQLGITDTLYWLAETTTKIVRPSAGRLDFYGAGTLLATLNGVGLTMNSLALSPGSTSSITYNGAGSIVITPTNRHVQLGAAGAVATNSAGGYVTIPSMAGAPTVAPGNIASAHTPEIYDSTNWKRWNYDSISARWMCLNRGGKGSDVASGGTVTIAAVDRTMRDYFVLTGTTACNYLTYTASDVYGDIRDGESVTFRLTGNITINHNTGSVPANTKPFFLQGAGNASLLNGALICFRRDDALGGFTEQFRRAV